MAAFKAQDLILNGVTVTTSGGNLYLNGSIFSQGTGGSAVNALYTTGNQTVTGTKNFINGAKFSANNFVITGVGGAPLISGDSDGFLYFKTTDGSLFFNTEDLSFGDADGSL